MSGKTVNRADFVKNLCEMVTEGAKSCYFSPKTTQKWAISHNPAQDLPKDSK